ncbi:DUF2934 domain-containing protein [Methylotenera versatilis]|uniref:DUF2934 domain-containing protein n=1 Tax=Methylotenera versatilis TaxID=1055487 RepID=UPI0006480763|nr:DUF2934 domain-containing protein [Methylotenera versatilis]
MQDINAFQEENHIPVIGKVSNSKSKCNHKVTDVALCAYYKAEARGYEPGHEIQDWLDAEAEIAAETNKGKSK